MPILRSPGCNCSCECLLIEELDYSTDIIAGDEHYIPHTIPKNTTVDLSKLIPDDFFKDESKSFTVKVKDTTGSTTHETLTFSAERDTVNLYEGNHKEIVDVPYKSKREIITESFYARRGYKRWVNIAIASQDDDYEAQSVLKRLEVGDVLYRIKSVSAGTFEGTEGIAHSRLASFNQVTEDTTPCNAGDRGNPSIFRINKGRYVFLENETTQTFNVYRFHRNSYPYHYKISDTPNVFTECIFNADRQNGSTTTEWTSGTTTVVHSHAATLSASSFGYNFSLRAFSSNFPDQFDKYDLYFERSFESADVIVLPTTSQAGDGHFELETTKVNGLAGSSTNVRVYRTNGNSTAVDVVVAVGNSDVTLNFAAGDIYKEFTINHISHDGETFTAAMTPTNDVWITSDVDNPLEFVFRENTYEVGNVDTIDGTNYFIRKVGGDELWKDKIPFQRTGWTDTSVRVYVQSNSDVTLEAYKIYEISHDPTCEAAGDNEDCPDYPRCAVISEYHSQQFDIDVDLGIPSEFFPSLSFYLNDGCKTVNAYWNDISDLGDLYNYGKWVFQLNYQYWNIESTETAANDYTGFFPADSSFTYEIDCGEVTHTTTYSSMPSGCAKYDTTVSCFSISCDAGSYTAGTVTETILPVTAEQDLETDPIFTGSVSDGCYDFVDCEVVDIASNNGVNRVNASATAVKAENIGSRSVADYTSACSGFESHLQGERFLVTKDELDLEFNTIWEWDGFANVYFGYPSNNCDVTYKGQKAPYEYDCSARATPDSPSGIATSVSSFLDSGGVGYWFNYTNAANSSDNGYYLVLHPSTLSGPFATANDGGSNAHVNVDEEVGIKVELKIDVVESIFSDGNTTSWLGRDSTFTQSELSGVQTLSFKAHVDSGVLGPVSKCIGDGGRLATGYSYVTLDVPLSHATRFNYGEDASFTPELDPGQPDHYTFSDCVPVDPNVTVLCVDPDFSAPDGTCWKVGDASYVTATCTSTTNSITDICCNSGTPTSQVVNYSYYDFSALPDWNGDVSYTGSGGYSSRSFQVVLGTISQSDYWLPNSPLSGLQPSNPLATFGDGPATLELTTAYYYYAVKWGDCWTGMGARSETWDGATDTVVSAIYKGGSLDVSKSNLYAVKTMSSGLLPYLEEIIPTPDLGPPYRYFMYVDLDIESNIIEKQNIVINVGAYNPTWQKF